jgi:hypothetical protein
MTTTAIHDMQTDHRFWLRDLERWQYDVDIWSDGREKLLNDAEQFMSAIRQFVDDVDAHAAAVREHQKAILTCEREMVVHAKTDAEQQHLSEIHGKSAAAHSQQLEQHRRLEQVRHTLMAQLKLLTS